MLGSAELQGWARSEAVAPGGLAAALWEERSVVRTWSMRGTLHVLTPAQLGVYSSLFEADHHYHEAWLRELGLSSARWRELTRLFLGTIGDGALSRRDLAEATGVQIGSWGSLLAPAARLGLIVQGPPRGTETTFVRVDRWLGAVEAPPRREARARMLRGYLRAYGPASRTDYGRWLGSRTTDVVREGFEALGPELATVSVAGREVHLLRSDLDALARLDGALPPALLLPAFDPLVLGHTDRGHLDVPAARRRDVFRAAGWISPTVLAGGTVVGTWTHRLRGRRLEVTATPFRRLRRAERAAIAAESRRLAGWLGRPLDLSYT